MRILLLASSFNGLTQRVWVELRSRGHHVRVAIAGDADRIRQDVAAADPDLVICPYLKERIPADVWSTRRVIIVHPGIEGDRGPSSLDRAIADGEREWGVTALEAVEEMDAGDVWATATFPMPASERKSALYNGPVTDAALRVVHEVVDAVAAGRTRGRTPAGRGRLRPLLRRDARRVDLAAGADTVLRGIHCSDGAPGASVRLAGRELRAYDAHAASPTGDPGVLLARTEDAVCVGTGDGAVWIGRLRAPGGIKLPATTVLAAEAAGLPSVPVGPGTYPEIVYRRDGDIGWLTVDAYNGAWSAARCRRIAAALDRALARDTRALVLAGGWTAFCNGIDLNAIEAAAEPAREAWEAIVAIDDVCRRLLTAPQVVVAAVTGNAGAGGVMLPLAADRVVARDGVVLNPHYATMGLYGSEYWTHTLPARVGTEQALRLTGDCLPVGVDDALAMGLVDATGPRSPADFVAMVTGYAERCAASADRVLAGRPTGRDRGSRPAEACRAVELGEMARDIFDDRHGFAAARRAFVHGTDGPGDTPDRLATWHTRWTHHRRSREGALTAAR